MVFSPLHFIGIDVQYNFLFIYQIFKIINFFYRYWWKLFLYYHICLNNFKLMKIFFLLKYCCLKTLLLKHNKILKSFRKLFCVYTFNLIIGANKNVLCWFYGTVFLNKNISIITNINIINQTNNNTKLIKCINCNSNVNNFFYYCAYVCFFCVYSLLNKLKPFKQII